MARAIKDLPQVELVDLYESNPDFHFDVAAEQRRVEQADLLVLQHPLHWYGVPGLLKQWIDVVLSRGWAYGHGGRALQGKDFMLAVTTGGSTQDYRDTGPHGHDFSAFLPPLRQTARFCGMHWQPPLILHAARRAEPAVLEAHIQRYCHLLETYPDWRADAGQTHPQG